MMPLSQSQFIPMIFVSIFQGLSAFDDADKIVFIFCF